jgi:hypothetical protein
VSVIVPEELRVYRFHPDGLDPVAVYVEQYGPRSSRMTIQCYAQAWTGYWGSHGDAGLEAFVCSCSDDYISNGLEWGTNGLRLKRTEKFQNDYLRRIICAIQAHFADQKGGTQ